MPHDWRLMLVAVVTFSVAAFGAETYARVTAPYYEFVAKLIAKQQPWKIQSLIVAEDTKSSSKVLRLTGLVYEDRTKSSPDARVEIRVQVGEAVETALVFWTLLLVWTVATRREYLLRLALGIPLFLVLEATTTGVQLVHSLAQASAILAGNENPMTWWERWSRFLEGGGQFALEVVTAALTIVGSRSMGARA